MVRFGENYAAYIDREYGVNSFINYDKLKKVIHANESYLEHKSDAEKMQSFSTLFFEDIFHIEEIYNTKMIELDYLFMNTQRLAKALETTKYSDKAKKKAHEAALKRHSTLVYQKLLKLDNYRLLNHTAVIKILKKHDKVLVPLHQDALFEDHMNTINTYNFSLGDRPTSMMRSVERLYADAFCDGLIEEAQNKLRIVKGTGINKSGFFVAFKAGAIVTLLLWLISDFIMYPHLAMLYLTMEDPAVYVYAAVAGLIVYRWIWGFNVFMWEFADIDYILLLDLDAMKHMPTHASILSEAADYTVLYLINVIIFHSLRHVQLDDLDRTPTFVWLLWHSYILPISLVIGTFIYIIKAATGPTSYGVFSRKVFVSLFISPFSEVHLRYTFAGDILTSFSKVIAAAAFAACYFTSGTFIVAAADNSDDVLGAKHFAARCSASASMHLLVTLINSWPAFIRLMQNFRQLYDYHMQKRASAKAAAIAAKEDGSVAGTGGGIGSNHVSNHGSLLSSSIHNPMFLSHHSSHHSSRNGDAADDCIICSYSEVDGDHNFYNSNNNTFTDMYTIPNGSSIHNNGYSNNLQWPQYEHGDSVFNEIATATTTAIATKPGSHSNINSPVRNSSCSNEGIRLRGYASSRSGMTPSNSNNALTQLGYASSRSGMTPSNSNNALTQLGISRTPSSNVIRDDGDDDNGICMSPIHAIDGTIVTPTATTAATSVLDPIEAINTDCQIQPTYTCCDVSDPTIANNSNSNRKTEFHHHHFLPRMPPLSTDSAMAAIMKLRHPGAASSADNSGKSQTPLTSLFPRRTVNHVHHKYLNFDFRALDIDTLIFTDVLSPTLGRVSKSEPEVAEPGFFAAVKKSLRCLLPEWFRKMVSIIIVWPFSFNAFKYMLQMAVVVFGAYPAGQNNAMDNSTYWGWYFTLCAFSTVYASYWDVVNDWGLLQFKPPRRLLREPLYYRDMDYFYYAVMVINPVFRALWVMSYTPIGNHVFFLVFEIFRRSLWACMRMELAYIQELKKRV